MTPAAPTTSSRSGARLAAAGAVLAAVAVALAAYAAHAAVGPGQARLQTAALFAFGHGLALAALAPAQATRTARVALGALLLGVLAFAGSLALSTLAGWPTTVAPAGGMLLIAGWLLLAFDLLRR